MAILKRNFMIVLYVFVTSDSYYVLPETSLHSVVMFCLRPVYTVVMFCLRPVYTVLLCFA